MKKKIGKAILFLACLSCTLYLVNGIVKFEYVLGENTFSEFYEQKRNSVDVMFFGTSVMYFSTSPAVLWDNYGIAAYDLGSPAQPLWTTYYYMKEALKYQKPKVMAIECYEVTKQSEYGNDMTQVKSISGMRLSENKWDLICASVPKEERMRMLLGFPNYHNRYAELEKKDFTKFPWNEEEHFYKGAMEFEPSVEAFTWNGVSDSEETLELAPKVEEYYEKIIELAEENDIELIFYTLPHCFFSEEDMLYNNKAKEIATEHGVPFLECYKKIDEIGIDFQTDTVDGKHLNAYGAEKFSKYLGKYLKEHYEIRDRRGDENYISWDNCSNLWDHGLLNDQLQKVDYASAYLDIVTQMYQKEYTIVMNVKGDKAFVNMDADSKDAYTAMGISDEALSTSGLIVVQDGVLKNYTTDEAYQHMIKLADGEKIEIIKDAADAVPVINYNDTDYNYAEDGISIFVYDDLLKEYVSAAFFRSNNAMLLNRVVLEEEVDSNW